MSIDIKFPGIYSPEELSNEAYHSGPGVGSSQFKTLAQQTPAHLMYSDPKQSAALDRGTAFHTAGLEPHLYEKTLFRGPAKRVGNAWKEAQEQATAEGKLLLVEGDYDNGLRMRDALAKKAHIQELLQKNSRIVEFSAYAEDDGIEQRVRPDLVLPDDGLMIDLKTTTNASKDKFTRAVFDYGYHIQAAMYPYIWQLAGGAKINDFLFLAVETAAPFEARLFRLDPDAFEQGWRAYKQAVALYRACEKTGEWPGYPADILDIEQPRWLPRIEEGEV